MDTCNEASVSNVNLGEVSVMYANYSVWEDMQIRCVNVPFYVAIYRIGNCI